MKPNRDGLRVAVIPNAKLMEKFDIVNIGGNYTIKDELGQNIYEKGACFNHGCVNVYFDGVKARLAIRTISYALRTGSDYHVLDNLVTPKGKNEKEVALNLRFFRVEDIRVTNRQGIPWKDLPRVTDLQWAKKSATKQAANPPMMEQSTMNLDSVSTLTRQEVVNLASVSPKDWDVVINGISFSFKNKEAMIEMCKALSTN